MRATSAGTGLSSLVWRVAALGLVENYLVGWRLAAAVGTDRAPDQVMPGMPAMADMPGMQGMTRHADTWSHYLRDTTVAAPLTVVTLVIVAVALRRLLGRSDSTISRLLFAVGVALAATLASVSSDTLTGRLFDAPLNHAGAGPHYLEVGLIALRYAFALGLLYAAFFGVPWARPEHDEVPGSVNSPTTISVLKES